MKYTYDESYLNDVQKNLGFFFQAALCNLHLPPDKVQQAFVESDIPAQIEFGNPDFLCGKSGYELLAIAFGKEQTHHAIEEALQEPFLPQAEFWSGSILAQYQWKSGLLFKNILEKFPLERLLSNYGLMHEADISKMMELIDEVVR